MIAGGMRDCRDAEGQTEAEPYDLHILVMEKQDRANDNSPTARVYSSGRPNQRRQGAQAMREAN